MKNFFKKICFFFLPILIISYPLDYWISYLLSKSNNSPGEIEVWNDIYSNNTNCDIAIYGSSRAWVQIDPEILGDSLNTIVYNFGMDGHNFWLQYLRHLEYQKHNKQPKIILQSMDIFTLQKRKDLLEQDQFLPYMLWNNNIRDYTKSFIGYTSIDYFVPLVRYIGKTSVLKTSIKNIVKHDSRVPYRQNGFRGIDKKWNDDFEKAKSQKESYEIVLDQNSINLFELFIRECISSGIELVLIYTPEYIDGQKYVVNREDIINIYTSFSKKYKLTFLDYSNDNMCLDKNLFYNASHLNKRGAELFSKKLAENLKYELSTDHLAEIGSKK